STFVQANASPIGSPGRVFNINTGVAASMSGFTIRNGKAPTGDTGDPCDSFPCSPLSNGGEGAPGGGILNEGSLTLINMTLSENRAGKGGTAGNVSCPIGACNNIGGEGGTGGGIHTTGDGSSLTVISSTFSNNHAGEPGDAAATVSCGSCTSGVGDTGNGGALNGKTVSVDLSTFTGNSADDGAGIQQGPAAITITRSTFHDNSASNTGGAINCNGALTNTCTISDSAIYDNFTSGTQGGTVAFFGNSIKSISNSTITGNESLGDAGGILADFGTVNLTFVTIADNVADGNASGTGDGGGIKNEDATVNLKNSIIADNTDENPNSESPQIWGTITSLGYNHVESTTGGTFAPTIGDVVGSEGGLAPLADNGGPTQTRGLYSNSPAIDAIPNGVNGCGLAPFDIDQRGSGFPRPVNGSCDKGAFEGNLGTAPQEIDVQGGPAPSPAAQVSIEDGDTTPSTSDGTDFGTTSTTVTRTFEIHNFGTSNLVISNPIITGANFADFSVSAVPTSPVAPGGSTTFEITFDPNLPGLRTAIVNVANNDPNESPYDFAIQGTGGPAASPPVANDDTGAGLAEDGANGTVNVLTNDTDPDGNPTAPVNGAGQFTVDIDTVTAGIQTTLTNAQGEWSLDTATGIVTFDPANNFNGTAAISYTLCDPTALCDNATITFAVSAVNDAPVANNITPAAFNEDIQSIITLSYTDIEADLATACAISSPTNVTVTQACSCSGAGVCTVGVTGTPTNYNGPASFTYTVTANSQTSNSATANLTISPVNDAPTSVAPTTASTTEDTTFSFTGGNTLSVADVDSSNLAVTLTVTHGTLTMTDISNVLFSTGDGTADATMTFSGTIVNLNDALDSLSFAPTPDYYGSASLSFSVSDGDAGPVNRVVALTVSPVADITDDSVSTNENTPITFNAIAGTNGATADTFEGSPSVASVTQGLHGGVSFLADGSLTYTPTTGYSGSDSFTYTVTSGGATETATVTVNIANTVPVTLVVDNLTDNIALNQCVTATPGDCSLRGAVSVAQDGDTIVFASDLSSLSSLEGGISTITLVGSEIAITSSVTISGPGADKLIINGGTTGPNRIFLIDGVSLNVTISGLTLTSGGGSGGGISSVGGAIFARCQLTLDGVHIYENSTTSGGGVAFIDGGPYMIKNSTINTNGATFNGGGI
ncbi:MAG: hypothetical protein DMF06_11570, partial [Verrucomicrobia bacterium]